MYFPALKKLKDSNKLDFDDIDTFEEVLFNIYEKKYHKRFNPLVYSYFGVELDKKDWINFLEKLSYSKFLNTNYELCCQCCDKTIKIFDKLSLIPFGEDTRCDCSNEIFTINSDDVFITYSFKEDFKPNNESEKLFRSKNKVPKNFSVEDMMAYPEIIFARHIEEKSDQLSTALAQCMAASDSTEKGKCLEVLAEKFLGDGLYLRLFDSNKRYSTGELDRVFKVKKMPGTVFLEFTDILIVECKNWSTKIGAKEIRDFSGKMDDVKSKTGIIISKEGITGDHDFILNAKGILRREWDRNDKIIIIFDSNDLERIISVEENLYTALENKYFEIKTL